VRTNGHLLFRQRIQGMKMSMEARIRTNLMIALAPTRLDVENQSHLHAGHASSPGTGESHFAVLVVSPRFAGLNRVGRHRLVNEALATELADGVHALAIRAFAPGEPVR
jgi:BolA protein